MGLQETYKARSSLCVFEVHACWVCVCVCVHVTEKVICSGCVGCTDVEVEDKCEDVRICVSKQVTEQVRVCVCVCVRAP